MRETLALFDAAPDLIAEDAPAGMWNKALNVLFRNGESVRVSGDGMTLPTTKHPRACLYVESEGQSFWAYANDAGIWVNDGSTEYDITPANWSGSGVDEVWTSCMTNGLAVFNASDRDPVYWDGHTSNICKPLPDWPSGGRCTAMRAHKSFLMAVGMLSEGAERVRWSSAAEPGQVPQHWTPAADNLAGFVDLAPLLSPCLEGVTLRNAFVILKRESIWTMTFVGGNTVFAVRKMFSERGIAGTNGFARDADDNLLFIGSDGDVYLSDGVSVRSVLDGKSQRAFYADFVSDQRASYSGATLMREKLAILSYPRLGGLGGDMALLYDFVSGAVGFRDMPDVACMADGRALKDVGMSNTWDGDQVSWDHTQEAWSVLVSPLSVDDVVMGGAFGFRLLSGSDETEFVDGPVEALLTKQGLALGDAGSRRLVSKLWPKIRGRNGDVVWFMVGGQEHSGGPVSWTQQVPYTIGQPGPIDVFASGRFMALNVSSLGGGQWRLGSIDVEHREQGGW